MNTLRHALELHRAREADAGHLCYAANADTAALVVETGHGIRWLLPWSHFLHGCHETKSGHESFVLTFTHHEVTLRGRSLGPLAAEVARLRLEKVRAIAEDYGDAASDEPLILEIHVQPAEPPPAAATPAPGQSNPASRNENQVGVAPEKSGAAMIR